LSLLPARNRLLLKGLFFFFFSEISIADIVGISNKTLGFIHKNRADFNDDGRALKSIYRSSVRYICKYVPIPCPPVSIKICKSEKNSYNSCRLD